MTENPTPDQSAPEPQQQNPLQSVLTQQDGGFLNKMLGTNKSTNPILYFALMVINVVVFNYFDGGDETQKSLDNLLNHHMNLQNKQHEMLSGNGGYGSSDNDDYATYSFVIDGNRDTIPENDVVLDFRVSKNDVKEFKNIIINFEYKDKKGNIQFEDGDIGKIKDTSIEYEE